MTRDEIIQKVKDSAFPQTINHPDGPICATGLTKREYFAGQAMTALVKNFLKDTETEMETLASVAVCMAEALEFELNKTQP